MYRDCPLNELCPLDGEGCFRFDLEPPDYSVGITGYTPVCVEQLCPCELTPQEEDALYRSITDHDVWDFIQSYEPPGI